MPDHFFSGSFGGKDTAKCFERENNSTFTLHKYLQYPFEKHWKHSEDLDDEVGVKLKAAYFYCLQSTHTHIYTHKTVPNSVGYYFHLKKNSFQLGSKKNNLF